MAGSVVAIGNAPSALFYLLELLRDGDEFRAVDDPGAGFVSPTTGVHVRVEGSDATLDVDLVFLAMGFTGPERGPLLDQLGVDLDDRGNVARSSEWATNVEGVFVAGDAGRGQSLIVWAIAEGRACAAAVDTFLEGHSDLPAPIVPTDRPLV